MAVINIVNVVDSDHNHLLLSLQGLPVLPTLHCQQRRQYNARNDDLGHGWHPDSHQLLG
jgi:hypothetical protein